MNSTPRLSAYFSFGLQWSTPSRADQSGNGGAAANRIVDVSAQPVSTKTQARKDTVRPAPRQSNIFLSRPTVTTYAPPKKPGQPVQLVTNNTNPGDKLDTWA